LLEYGDVASQRHAKALFTLAQPLLQSGVLQDDGNAATQLLAESEIIRAMAALAREHERRCRHRHAEHDEGMIISERARAGDDLVQCRIACPDLGLINLGAD